MTAEQLNATLAVRSSEIHAVTSLWNSLVPTACPDGYQVSLWLDRHNLDTVVYAVRETAKKFHRLGCEMTLEHMIRFASKCMNCAGTSGRKE
jgi:hypothetical protein